MHRLPTYIDLELQEDRTAPQLSRSRQHGISVLIDVLDPVERHERPPLRRGQSHLLRRRRLVPGPINTTPDLRQIQSHLLGHESPLSPGARAVEHQTVVV